MPLKTDIVPANPAAAELRPTLFATAGTAPAQQLDLWQSHYGSFNRLNFTPLQGEGFVARNEVWNLGAIALSRNVAPAGGFAREASHIRRDSIDHWVIRIARTGMARYRSPSSNFATRPNVPFLFSLGETSDGDRNGADWLSLYIPRDSFAELTIGLDAVGNALLDLPMAGLLGDYLEAFERRLPSMTAADVPALVEATRAMVAACVVRNATAVRPGDLDVARRERVRQVIHRHLASPSFGPRQVSRLTGISRSQLYRLFEPSGGVAHYIQQRRLRAAQMMLCDPANRCDIHRIAEQVGFSDASTFSRAFRRNYQCSPTDARALSQCGIALPLTGNHGQTSPIAEFGGLLRDIGSRVA